MKRILKALALFAAIAIAISLPVFAVVKRQDIYDWIRLRGYEPPKAVSKLASDDTMTPYATKVFYVNRPQIVSDKAEFSNACEQTEQSIVLGCYVSGAGIYLYKVSDKRLNGIIEVTAAHEMLHAAYDRLSSEERARVDDMISKAFKDLNNTRIKETIERYRKQDPSIVANELHSIMGTEVNKLPKELEQYYAKYFNDRSIVVSYSEAYESEFGARQAQVGRYDDELEAMKAQIEQSQTNLDQLSSALDDERKRVTALGDSGNTAAYNIAASAYNKQVAEYNVQARQLQQLIDEYNELVKKRNALAVEVQGLVEAIDSRPETIQ